MLYDLAKLFFYIQNGGLKTHSKDTPHQSERKDTAVDWGAKTDGGTKKANKENTADSAKDYLDIAHCSSRCTFVCK